MHIQTKRMTLLEVTVVLLIISILISFILPAFRQFREASYQLQCTNNYKQIGTLLKIYSIDNKGYLPRFSSTDYHGGIRDKNNKILNAANTTSWHGHLAPYIYEKINNNWNESHKSQFIKTANNSEPENSWRNKLYWPVESIGTLKVFLCPKAVTINFVARLHAPGLPFTYMASTVFFGSKDSWKGRAHFNTARLDDIEDPSGKVLVWEAAPHRVPYVFPKDKNRMYTLRAEDDPLNMFSVATSPKKWFWTGTSNSQKGGSDAEKNGNHHWSMYFIHDSDNDNLEGYQMSLFADGSAHKVHEWWLYLNAGDISSIKNQGVAPGTLYNK